MKKYISLFILLFAVLSGANAQDFSFSQYHYTPLLTNPAAVASMGDTKAWVNYRRQHLMAGDVLSSPMASFSMPFSKQKGGFGLTVVNDRQGQGLITTGFLAAGNYKIDFGSHKISMGMQFGLLSRQVDLAGLSTSSQFINGAYDPNANLNESLINQAKGYPVFGGGVFWYKPNNGFHHKAFLGASLLNINQPDAAFIAEGGNNAIPIRLIMTGGLQVYKQGRFAIVPNARVINASGYTFANAGTWFRFNLDGDMFPQNVVSLGAWYNTNGYGTGSVEWEAKKFFAAFSYDVAFEKAAKTFQDNGTVELTMGIRFRKPIMKDGIFSNWPTGGQADTLVVQSDTATHQGQVPTVTEEVVKNDTTSGVKPTEKSAEKPDEEVEETVVIEKPVIEPEEVVNPEEPIATTKSEFGEIKFELGSSRITNHSMHNLKRLIHAMKKDPNIRVELVGHTCDIGDEQFNRKLSLKRAENVKEMMIYFGAPNDRITTRGVGFDDPLVPNTSEANRLKNRRVEMNVIR